jgi:hypothetical protein
LSPVMLEVTPIAFSLPTDAGEPHQARVEGSSG